MLFDAVEEAIERGHTHAGVVPVQELRQVLERHAMEVRRGHFAQRVETRRACFDAEDSKVALEHAPARECGVHGSLHGRNVARSSLTRICPYRNIRPMESAFAILAEPNRRAMLNLLATSERTVGELERELGMAQPSVSKHLRVLREAGLLAPRVHRQVRLYPVRA